MRGATCSLGTEDWWTDASAAVLHEETGADLPASSFPVYGMAWHYPMIDFLKWINSIIWAKCEKYYRRLGGVGEAPCRRFLLRLPLDVGGRRGVCNRPRPQRLFSAEMANARLRDCCLGSSHARLQGSDEDPNRRHQHSSPLR
jgi:hypothetical protein